MPEEEPSQFVTFKLGDEEYGVDVLQVREIVKPTTITRVPRSPWYVDGLINLRGSLAPVVNLRRRFGFDPKEIDENARIIIAELDGKSMGMVVDAATEVLMIPVEDIEEPHEIVTTEVSKNYMKGVGKVGKRLIIILDLAHLLTSEEIDEIKDLEGKRPKITSEAPKKEAPKEEKAPEPEPVEERVRRKEAEEEEDNGRVRNGKNGIDRG